MENRTPGGSGSSSALEIEVIAGLPAGSKVLVEDELVLGRQTGGPGQIPDAEMSRRHARIAREAGGDYAIEDLGSSNGTFVNGLQIAGPTLLSVGDTIELGGASLVVRALPAPADPGPQPPVAPAPADDSQRTRVPPPSSSAGAAATPPTLAVRLEVDFEAGTATVALDEGGDAVTMSFLNGNWRAT
ncbi:MAG TPA: FHA domain-containing protein [Solirubrobacteraceae bacterium]|nr:FHA domain-containing protein [Solirubrobacteraceae bacterium]